MIFKQAGNFIKVLECEKIVEENIGLSHYLEVKKDSEFFVELIESFLENKRRNVWFRRLIVSNIVRYVEQNKVGYRIEKKILDKRFNRFL